jgi:transposase
MTSAKPQPPKRQRKTRKLDAATQQRLEDHAEIATMPVLHPHAAGIDIGDTTHWVCVGTHPDGTGIVREFPAHTRGLRQLVAYLREHHIQTVALEATGVYGHVAFLTLLQEGFQTIITPPQFARQIKGRPKTDKRDCQWIYRLHMLGLLPSVFQPDEATQTLRDYVRQRANHVRLSSHHIQRMQKALQMMNLKLTHVVGDITGVTGLKIIRAIIGGERDAKVLAGLRDRRCKHTEDEIVIALEGRYRAEHVLELQLSLQVWETYQRMIQIVDIHIHKHLQSMKKKSDLPPLPEKKRVRGRKPHDPAFDVRTALYMMLGVDLTMIDGIDEVHALTLVGELGTDFTKWPTVKHFTSWLGLCPNFQKTGGKVKSSRTRKGKGRAAIAFRLAAWGLMRSPSALGAFLRRKRSHLGAPKAITATAHKLARIVYAMVRYGTDYVRQTEAEYAAHERARQEANLHRRAKQLGYELTKIEPPSPSDSSSSSATAGGPE